MKSQWEKVGEIGVDAGLCWIGDPCYIIHANEYSKSIGKNWGEFCDKLKDDATQFNYDLGHPGLGVAVSTGYGDGTYDVEVRRADGRIKELRVKFF